mmetsp:Transcript_7050/g.17490  ORF Transcript_7050/g.17490 Transcript_7050/m.17490 type:complete len:241 (+) Transcript_7050:755-1477(+)
MHGTDIIDDLDAAAAAAAGGLHDPEVGSLLLAIFGPCGIRTGGTSSCGGAAKAASGATLPGRASSAADGGSSLCFLVLLLDLRKTLDEERVLFWKNKGSRADRKELGQLTACSRVPVDTTLQAIFAREVFVLREVIDFLPRAQPRVVQLGLAPSPAQVPDIRQTEPVGQLLPTLHSVEHPCNDVVDFGPILHDLVIPHGEDVLSCWQRPWHPFLRNIRHLVDDALQEDTIQPCPPRVDRA